MFDDLAAFYHENVVSAFIDYREVYGSGIVGRSRDLRSALIAATALFHLREHLPKAKRLSRAAVEKHCSDYGILGDIVNAAKHKTVTNPTPHGAPLVDDATQICEQTNLTEYKDEIGAFWYAEKTVIARLRNGSERNLLEILTNVINFWEQYLNSLGVIASARTFICSSNVYPRSRAESEKNRHDIEIVQGQRYLEFIRFQRFNYNTGTVEPIDLTGCQVRSRIYKPSYELDLWLTNDATGIEFKRTISLSENENEALSLLKTDAEQQAYIKSLPSAQEGLRLLAIEDGITQNIILPKQPSDSQQMIETANQEDAPDQEHVR